MRTLLLLTLLTLPYFLFAQKKPLDHSVYDSWQSIGERMISNDGNWVVYTVVPQEGDGALFIQPADGRDYYKKIPRGYSALITEDSRYVVFKIKPLFKETRDARIKKKKPEEMPKDSIGIIELGKDQVIKRARIKSYKAPEKSFGWLAFQKEKDPPAKPAGSVTQKTVDSLRKTIDSLVMLVTEIKNLKSGNRDDLDADEDPSATASANEGSDLMLYNFADAKEKLFKNVVDYYFNKYGQKLVMRVSKSPKDSTGVNAVVLYDLQKLSLDTILKGGNDFRNFSLTEDGNRIAFVAERDSAAKALQKFYKLYIYQTGNDSASVLIEKNSTGMQTGMTVSENGLLSFSKSGKHLFFGTAPILPPRDTTLVDFETAKLDIWHYNDDYLQTIQLFQLNNELKRSYLAVYDLGQKKMEQLGSKSFPTIIQTNEGDGETFIAVTDTGRRVESQWSGSTKKDVYAVNVKTGVKTLVKKNHEGQIYPSSTGKYILLYDSKLKNYFSWDGRGLKNISSQIKLPLYDEEHDSPGEPTPYGVMGWHEGDTWLYVYDRYDVWKIDPAGIKSPKKITLGRKGSETYRYIKTDRDERFIKPDQSLYFRVFDNKNKNSVVVGMTENQTLPPAVMTNSEQSLLKEKLAVNYFIKAQDADVYLFSMESFVKSPDLYVTSRGNNDKTMGWHLTKLSSINSQQSNYNWGTAELYKWKTFNGKPATGILYKPEDFDSTKKYPMLLYFYEKMSDGLHSYIPPSPTPSRLNISFFVSRGYIVLAPDISYTKGHPAKSAYDYIVSGAQDLAKKKWVDAKNIGIQGQSWGGIQVAQMITMTNMFKAAWAGAPVANMFSAYGGIRWESGSNRQMQYEKGQSRIGATPWEKPELYIENSPLFHLKKVTTPLVIMHNDADGAVPWYQGIELFTAMRRLNKKVWMLNYNGEAHNLVERRNRKDIQIREQQYFDWLLKGEKPPKWIVEGVPAVNKGRDWGLEVMDSENN